MTILSIQCRKNSDESQFYKKVKNKCKDCLTEILKCQVNGKFFTEKWLTTHIEREHQNESNSSVSDKPKIDDANTDNNNRTLIVGTYFSGKTYLILKILSRTPNRDIIKSPNHLPNSIQIPKSKSRK